MKIYNMEMPYLRPLMVHLFKLRTVMALVGKVIMITLEVQLQHQEMLVQELRMPPIMLLRIGVEISLQPRRPNPLLKMETQMPIEPSGITLWVSIIFSDFKFITTIKMANVCRFNILQLPTIIFLIFIGRSLGQGTFGKVRLGTHLITGEKVAIKILEKDKIKDQSDVERVTREIHILKIVRHPNVIQLYEVSI